MITPAYALTATERVLPRLALDFTTAIADPRVATTRASNTATRFNANGLIEIVNANLPRFDFSPTTLVCLGQLIEETRTNLFLNSLIDGTNLATQSVTLSAVAHTMSFYGSGTVTISGGHSATVAGVGDFPNRRTYTFTPTAGSSTFTVSGDVKFAQLEAGTFATSYIPTTTTSLTRNADVVTMTGANFSSWFNASEGAFAVEFQLKNASQASTSILSANAGSINNRLEIGLRSTGTNVSIVTVNTATVAVMDFGPPTTDITKQTLAYKENSFAGAKNGGSVGTDNAGALPVVNSLNIGSRANDAFCNCWIKRIDYWPQRVLNAEAQAFSKG